MVTAYANPADFSYRSSDIIILCPAGSISVRSQFFVSAPFLHSQCI
jgi:hypothetical protein